MSAGGLNLDQLAAIGIPGKNNRSILAAFHKVGIGVHRKAGGKFFGATVRERVATESQTRRTGGLES